MDNLKLITQFVLQKSDLITGARCLSVDPLVGIIWVATDTAVYNIHVDHNEIEPIGCLNKADSDKFLVYCDDITADAEIVIIDCVSSIESICIAVNTGEVLLLHSSPHELECVGCCDGGIGCMAWSPDQEVVLFVTNDHKLILMTKDFDIISEQSADQAGFGEAEPINVGWGKKETQFHGSLGKAAAQSKQESNTTLVLSDNDNSYVSWRGDGQYFICSTINPDTGKRLMRVWSRDLTLHSTIESLEGLEYPLCWRPSGNLVSSVQRKPHKHDIVFFEQNGLQHGSFTLPFGKDEVMVRQLLWNTSSSVLGVWLEPLQSDCKGNHCVQLWTMSNYHWYLKMELNFTNAAKEVAAILWDPVCQLKLHIITKDGQYASYDFMWEVSQSEGSSHSNQASIVLIDGGRLLYTAFRKCVIPPPMCAHVLTIPETMAIINQVSFSPCLQYMLVLSSMGHIMIYCLSQDGSLNKDQHGFQSKTPCPKLLNSTRFPLDDDTSVVLPRHLTWYREKQLLGVKWDIIAQSDYLYQYSITYDNDDLIIDKVSALPCEQEVIAVYSNSTKVAIQLSNGSILEYSAEEGLMPWMLKDGSSLQLKEPCPHMQLATFNGKNEVVGLSQTAKLYVDITQLAANCSSFYVHDNFLLLTTHWHTIHCISLHQDVSELKLLTNDNTGHENIRNVERGSRIVTAVSCDTRVVLQMPRGNLETISPRALVLSHLRKLLDNKEFGEAFVMMRKHRINMNLLYDHNPQLFLDNVTQFVQQLLTVGGLDLFLSELSDQDVTITMYTGHHGQQHNKDRSQSNARCEGKVDLVCDAILKCLDDLGGGSTYLLATITALVKKTIPELETVLMKIKQLQAAGTVGNGITAEDALKHSLFLVDVNQLYDVALGMYDFDLVLMVAEKSQRDPKEYLPFLNRLRKMDDHYQKYSIDCHLQRYPKALRHLSKCNDDDRFKEALSLIKAYNLYALGLDLYSTQPEQYMAIAHAFGSYLVAKKHFKEAVLMFRRAQDLPAALEACEGWGCWQQAFVLSAELYQSEEERMALARRMADKMKQKRQHRDAAHVLSQYANDPEEAIVVLLEGGAWGDALCMAHQTGRTDLTQTNIEPAILEAYQAQVSTVEALDVNFTQFSTRLTVVKKSKDASTRILADGTVMEEKEDDLFSETSSIASLHSAMASSSIHTRSTAHSKKNRRKAEKKKYNLKEGSLYEDIALIKALADVVTTVDNMQSDIGELLTVLIQFNHDTLARQLQQVFAKLVNMIKEQMNSIWPPTSHNVVTPLTGPQSTVNSIVTGHLSADVGRSDLPPAPSLKSVHWRLDFL